MRDISLGRTDVFYALLVINVTISITSTLICCNNLASRFPLPRTIVLIKSEHIFYIKGEANEQENHFSYRCQ